MTATDTATEVVADVAEEVAEVSRAVSGRGLGLAFGAFLIGAGIGGGLAYLLTRRHLETKYNKIADTEIAEMREHYRSKVKAAEGEAQKGALEAIVTSRGYVSPDTEPPMAVQPPESVATSEEEAEAPEANDDEEEVRNVFREAEFEDVWDYHEEQKRRSPGHPYVIHYDEINELQYQSVTLTYYEVDDVLCTDRDEIFDRDKRNELVGEANLGKFGHGSNDASIVYVRNDELELMYEIVKSPNSFSEEVHGFSHDAYSDNLGLMRKRERHEPED